MPIGNDCAQITVILPRQTLARIDRWRKELRISRTALVRLLIDRAGTLAGTGPIFDQSDQPERPLHAYHDTGTKSSNV